MGIANAAQFKAFWALLVGCAAVLLMACKHQPDAPANADLPESVSAELYQSVFDELAAKGKQPPAAADIMAALAQRLTATDQLDSAVACWARVPSDDPRFGAEARRQQGLLLISLHHATEAEKNLREFIALAQSGRSLPSEQVAEALDMLRFLLGVELRFEERHGILRAIHVLEAADTNDAITYCFPSVLRWNGEQAVHWLEEFLEQDPDDMVLRIALGRYRIGEGRLDEGEQILRACCDERPGVLSAQAALLACLYERADWDQMDAKLRELPAVESNEPWLLLRLRGHVHNHFGRFQEAAKAFTLAIEADPSNGESYLGLGKALAGLQRQEESETALRKANVIARIQNRLGWIQVRPEDVAALWEVAELCEEIDLGSRATVIARHILKLAPQHEEAQELLTRLATRPKE